MPRFFHSAALAGAFLVGGAVADLIEKVEE